MSSGTEGLDGELGPLIPMCKEAVDAIPLALLDHRGESLKAQSTFPYRLVQVFGLGGAKVFRAVAKFRSKVCEKSEHKPVQLSFFRLVYLEINPII